MSVMRRGAHCSARTRRRRRPRSHNEDLAARCLAITASFETGVGAPDCFCGISGDFDGQGISFGVLQWNFGQGSLQPLLREIVTHHAEVASTSSVRT